ncbi:MAG: hypothetical protein U5K43_04865 [Halofilum sp. (in: g-proteobacteria)]|nr:hypothetical protein [Halofilum sp. (in: g-proteobacteria)]
MLTARCDEQHEAGARSTSAPSAPRASQFFGRIGANVVAETSQLGRSARARGADRHRSR